MIRRPNRVAIVVSLGVAGCQARDSNQDCPDCQVASFALVGADGTDVAAILGFESLQAWTATSGKPSLSTTHSEGAHSLSITKVTSTELRSVAFAPGAPLGDEVALDVYFSSARGKLTVFLDAPSRQLTRASLGRRTV